MLTCRRCPCADALRHGPWQLKLALGQPQAAAAAQTPTQPPPNPVDASLTRWASPSSELGQPLALLWDVGPGPRPGLV